jgi:glycosyltransferase involved in cell wall biosynthesis
LADIFALPRTGEGFGIVFLESMLSVTPVISVNKDGSVDAIQNGYLGKLVNPCKVASITQGITDLLKKRSKVLVFSKKIKESLLIFS